MQTAYIAAFCVSVVLLVIVTGVSPRRSHLSRYELERRRLGGDQAAASELDRELVLSDVISLIRVVAMIVLVFVVLSAVAAFGWGIGCVVSVIVAFGYGRVASYGTIHKAANQLYQPYDAQLVGLIQKRPWIGRLVRTVPANVTARSVSSREELAHVIDQSGHFLSVDEKQLLVSGLHFAKKTVESIMVPRGAIKVLQKTDLVGPLMLDELHRTGHSRFLVLDGDIDHVVGVLHIRTMLELLDKKSQTAEKAMEKSVYYIHQGQTLGDALAAFLKTRHQLFVVVNDNRETTGLLTLEDVIEQMLGHEIVDAFDIHDDVHAVAGRVSAPKD